MIIGIECTAHTFGVAVVEKGEILSNCRDMYLPLKGGIIPMESAKHHLEVAETVWKKALNEAGIEEKKIDYIAVSNAPGLAPCLIAGLEFAKKKAKEIGVPIVAVNHCIAHLEIGRSEGANDPVLLYASGANTQIISFVSGKYRVFGETLDSGIGNFIDTFARYCGIAFPGGPEIENLAKKSNRKEGRNSYHNMEVESSDRKSDNDNEQIKKLNELPYSIKGMDVSFSGMQTKLKQMYDKKIPLPDLAYSLQEYAFAMLVEAAERALAHTGKKELVLGGGVACNKRLQEMCKIMCKERRAKFFCPKNEFLVDNAAMIAFTGELAVIEKRNNGKINQVCEDNGGVSHDDNSVYRVGNLDKLDIAPRERTDEVEVTWR